MSFQKIKAKYCILSIASLILYLNPVQADIGSKYPQDPLDKSTSSMGSVLGPNGVNLFNKSSGTRKQKKLKNGYKALYQAAIDYLSYRDIVSASFEGGDIITDWYQEGSRETKVTVLVKGEEITKDSLIVRAFSRSKDHKHHQDTELENKIAEEIIKKIESDFLKS